MNRQAEKYHISLAGEFYVAAELQRRQIGAAVTYGNAKKADVVAFSGGSLAVTIEVKSTPAARWVVGGWVPKPSPTPWVFVYLPTEPTESPEFFVLDQRQLHELLIPGDLAYREKYRKRHGKEYGKKRGVVTLTREQAAPFKNRWKTITMLLERLPEQSAGHA